MPNEEARARLEEYRESLLRWRAAYSDPALRGKLRTYISQNSQWVRRQTIEAKCYRVLTISPPPLTGGLIFRNLDPFATMFDPPYNMDLISDVVDMINETIGVLLNPVEVKEDSTEQPVVEVSIVRNYAFVAMPMDPDNPDLEDVLDAIKEAALRCGIQAERVDEPQTNERITDRILESIRRAEYVIVDLTSSRPNVLFEAGYAHGIGKLPVYIARHGTKLEFDLKDYPVIFFKNFKQLKDSLEKRLRGLVAKR